MQNQLQHIGIAAGLTTSQPRQLRSACDICHEQKVRCSGRGSRCTRCYKKYVVKSLNLPKGAYVHNSDLVCHYSYIGRRGKPKGSKNKKTLEKERINAIATLKSSTRYVESQMSHGSGTQTRSLADGLASQGLFSSSPQPSTLPFSPNTLDFNFLDPNLETLDTLEIGASSQGEIILSEAVMLDPIMLDDPSSSFGPQLRSSTKPIRASYLFSVCLVLSLMQRSYPQVLQPSQTAALSKKTCLRFLILHLPLISLVLHFHFGRLALATFVL